MAEEKNQERRWDVKTLIAGGGISAALFTLTPLNEYIDRSQRPLQTEMSAIKEVQQAKFETVSVKLENIQSTADEIKKSVQEQGRTAQELQLRIQNLEFVTHIKTKER